jgi:hypothetical protein
MTLKKREPAPRSTKHDPLLDALVAELRAPHDFRQPIITEDHRTRDGVVHVQVVWDQWQDCPELERWEIIREAYQRVKGPDFANRIMLATGVTVPEAARFGFLPFQVIPMRRKTDALSQEQYARAMIEEGASVLENPSKPMLRFETLEEAEVCQERLERRLPGSHWSIVHDLGMQ